MFANIVNIVTVALIVESFLCAFMAVRLYAKEDCLERIEESTEQMGEMFDHHITENRNKLTVFADILAANASNPDEQLKVYMKNFCSTQYFSAVSIHRANGSTVSYGEYPHDETALPPFEEEAQRLPYISEVYAEGDRAEDRCFYQAVPIIRDGETVGILYGYVTLDVLPEFISSTAYDGNCEFYIVDGNTGDFIMNETRDTLDNLYDGSIGSRKVRDGYSYETMLMDMCEGRAGYLVYESVRTGMWTYIYYSPLGINNWVMQLSIDEDVAFESYDDISKGMMLLAVCVIVLMLIHVIVLMGQASARNKRDVENLHRAAYVSEVKTALLNAHNSPEYIEQALRTIAGEAEAETVMLLTVDQRVITGNYYWPSKDSYQATNLIGRNIRLDFPVIAELLQDNRSVIYRTGESELRISDTAREIFRNFDVSNVMLVPIVDNTGLLKGCLCAVNVSDKISDCSALEAVTYDFFMAITNVENHRIIRNMGAMDYLTNTKNRNSFESEVGAYAALDCRELWCVYVDANGLHEVNNSLGHKAGDIMLCAVADAVKKAFGAENCYRTGGDEFVAFAADLDREGIFRAKRLMNMELAVKGFNVSIGFAGGDKRENGLFPVEKLLAEAEELMYREKRSFYMDRGMDESRM